MNPKDLAAAKQAVEDAVFEAVAKALLPYEGKSLVFVNRNAVAHEIADQAGACIEKLRERLKLESP